MTRTIAQRAASGENLNAPDLTREEQGELLVWARDQDIPYEEVRRRYRFTQTAAGLRHWHMQIVRDHPDRVATYTDADVCLLHYTFSPYSHFLKETLLYRSIARFDTKGEKLTQYSFL